MEIIKIGSNSFKISLTQKEAKELEITNASDEIIGDNIKKLISSSKLSEEIDFKTQKLATEIFVANDGACDIFVSRQNKESTQVKAKKESSQKSLYSFDSLHNLSLVSKRLGEVSYNREAVVYYDQENSKYFLSLTGIYPKDIKYAFICEYGERVKNNLIFCIEERCKRICQKNSLEILSNLL